MMGDEFLVVWFGGFGCFVCVGWGFCRLWYWWGLWRERGVDGC